MKILLVGTGGYAALYLKILLDNHLINLVLEGIVDPYYAASQYREQIEAAKIPVYDTMEEFYAHHTADLAVIATPTFLHCEQSICALAHHSDVLCEKPAAPTTKEAQKMLEAEKKYGHFIAIGYQWSYAKAIQSLKEDIQNGTLGKPESFKTIISWPRSRAYYKRGGGWGGKIQKDGRLLLDSIASNACAHYLHNMFFLLGDTMETSTSMDYFEAKCYRANEIENFDTCCIKMKTKNGVKLFFAATHAAEKERNPEFVYTFEKAKVTFSSDQGSLIEAEFKDGTKKVYGDPFADDFRKLWACIEAVKTGTAPVCTVRTAFTHVQLIEDLYKTTPIQNFDEDRVYIDEMTDRVCVKDLFEQICLAYETES